MPGYTWPLRRLPRRHANGISRITDVTRCYKGRYSSDADKWFRLCAARLCVGAAGKSPVTVQGIALVLFSVS